MGTICCLTLQVHLIPINTMTKTIELPNELKFNPYCVITWVTNVNSIRLRYKVYISVLDGATLITGDKVKTIYILSPPNGWANIEDDTKHTTDIKSNCLPRPA